LIQCLDHRSPQRLRAAIDGSRAKMSNVDAIDRAA
jgi:hypothetical protein